MPAHQLLILKEMTQSRYISICLYSQIEQYIPEVKTYTHFYSLRKLLISIITIEAE